LHIEPASMNFLRKLVPINNTPRNMPSLNMISCSSFCSAEGQMIRSGTVHGISNSGRRAAWASSIAASSRAMHVRRWSSVIGIVHHSSDPTRPSQRSTDA
jgi:hypothetical protein